MNTSLEQTIYDATAAAVDSTVTPETSPAPTGTDAPVDSAVETPSETPSVASDVVPDADASAATPSASASPAPFTDDAIVDVMVDGESVSMPWKEAKRLISGTAASTKRFQQAADLRKQAEGEKAAIEAERQRLAALGAQLENVMRDEQKFAAMYMALKARRDSSPAGIPAPAAPTIDPATILHQVEETVMQRLNAVRVQEQEQKTAADLTEYTKALVKDDPILNDEAVLGSIFETVAKMAPTSIEEAKSWIADQIKARQDRLQQHLDSRLKAAAITKAKAATATQRGGAVVTPESKTYDLSKPDDLERDITAFLAAQSA